MVGALKFPAPASPEGPPSTFLSVDGGRSQFSSSGTSQGARHRCFLGLMVGFPGSPALAPLRGPRRRCFLALMVGALRSIAPTPPRGPTIDVCYIDGGCSWISISTSQVPAVDIFYIMVDAPGSLSVPAKGSTVDVS
jgi:hypothetical protein